MKTLRRIDHRTMLRHTLPRPSIYALTPEKQREYFDKAEYIYRLAQMQERNGGFLPRGYREEAAKRLSISFRHVNNVINRCRNYWSLYPEEPRANALISLKRGRPSSTILTEEQEFFIIYAYLNKEWIGFINGDAMREYKNMLPTEELVSNLFNKIWPNSNISITYVRAFIKKQRKSKTGLFTLAREGRQIFFQEHILKKINDVDRPNIRWQWDARPLPIFILHEGVICTVTCLAIIDDFSRKAIAWILLPRKIIDSEGKIRKCDFTSDDARALLAYALDTTGVRCALLYNDNGKQFKGLEPLLKYLTDPGEAGIEMIYSKRGQPQGRGKIEAFLKQLTRAVETTFGFINERRRRNKEQTWRDVLALVQKHPELLRSLTDLRAIVDSFIEKKWNGGVLRRTGKTRQQVWEEGRSSSLPAPPEERYLAFGTAEMVKDATPTKDGIYYGGTYYHPVEPGGHTRLAQAQSDGKDVPFVVTNFGESTRARARLDGKRWEIFTPCDQDPLNMHTNQEVQEDAISYYEHELQEGFTRLFGMLKEKYGWDRPGYDEGTKEIVPAETIKKTKEEQKKARKPKTASTSTQQSIQTAMPTNAIENAETTMNEPEQSVSTNDILEILRQNARLAKEQGTQP